MPANIEAETAAANEWANGPLAANLAAAERGNAAAQYAMGVRYMANDFGVPQDHAVASRWYRMSADQDFAGAQKALADAFVESRGVPQSDSDAVKWFQLAAVQGLPGAQASLGTAFELGRGGLDVDLDEARRLYLLAAAYGLPEAPNDLRHLGFSPSGALVCRTCFALPSEGTELQRCSGCKEAHYCGASCQRAYWGPRHKDECRKWKAEQAAQQAAMEAQEAIRQRWLDRPLAEVRSAADKGDAAAQSMMGHFYRYGQNGLAKVARFAAELFSKAAAQGDAFSQYNLSVLFWHGDGVARSAAEGARLDRLAAKQGLAQSMYNLAEAMKDGAGCEKDPVLAMKWMRRSAELGFTNAQAELGAWYMQGPGTLLPVNYKEALRLSRLAADKGHCVAFANLGSIFANGLGVPRDLDEACRFLCRAVALGFEPAKNDLRRLASLGHEPSVAAVRELSLGPL